MKWVISLIVLCFTISPTFAEELYSGPLCWNSMNKDTHFSPEMNQKFIALDKGGWLSNYASFELSIAVAAHRSQQCKLMKTGKKYEAQCPVGRTLFIDSFAQEAIDTHGHKQKTAIQKLSEIKGKELRTAIKKMMEDCK